MENTGTRRYNVAIDAATRKRLRKIAAEWDATMGEVVERLVESEYESEYQHKEESQ